MDTQEKVRNELKPKEIVFNDDCLDRLLAGCEIVAKAVGATMGPGGRLAILAENPRSLFPYATKDGVTVAKEIILKDRFQKAGAEMLLQAAYQQLQVAGDGTTLTTILAYELFREGVSLIKAGFSRELVIDGIRAGMAHIQEGIVAQIAECRDHESLYQVALIALNGNEALAKIISDAILKVGECGLIGHLLSKDEETVVEYTSGFQWNWGIQFKEFGTSPQGYCSLENASILVTDYHFKFANEIHPLLTKLAPKTSDEKPRPLIIICPEITGDALSFIAKCCKDATQGTAFVAWVQPEGNPGTRMQAQFLEDVAAYVGATYIPDHSGTRMKTVTPEMLGTCTTFYSIKNKTIIECNPIGTITERVTFLKAQLETIEGEYEKSLIKTSIARLSAGIATIKVGGTTESEKKELYDRVDDAIRATRCAYDEGVVIGGGVALLRARTLPQVLMREPYLDYGMKVVFKAIEAPIRTILSNAGHRPDLIVDTLLRLDPDNLCFYDVTYGTVVKTEGALRPLDPAKVVISALKNACSVACTLLKTSVLIVNHET